MFKRWLLKTFFKPVRAYKLTKAFIRTEQTPNAVLSSTTIYKHREKNEKGFEFSVHYNGSLDSFRYDDENLFKIERDIIEGMVNHA